MSLPEPLRVHRSVGDARRAYDRMSAFYDLMTAGFERPARRAGIDLLAVEPGESVCEIGYATGAGAESLVRAVGAQGSYSGIDISPKMADKAARRLARLNEGAGEGADVDLRVGDARRMPFDDCSFDVVFCSFTLELFDTPDMPGVIREARRVLVPRGRLGVVSMALTADPGVISRAYEYGHRHFEAFVDCRPIDSAELVRSEGFSVTRSKRIELWRLPVDIVVATRGSSDDRQNAPQD